MTDAVQEEFTLSHVTRFGVYYEDTDFSGFVYHANYLKFFERGREHLLGIEYLKDLFAQGTHFVVAKMEVQFHRPARHGDWLKIETTCRFNRSPTLIFEQKARRDGDGELLVSGIITAVCLNRDNRPTRLPADVIGYLSQRRFNDDKAPS